MKKILFNYVNGFGDSTQARNIKKFVGLGNGETYGLDINGKWHNGYFFYEYDQSNVPRDCRNPKLFLSRFPMSDNDISEIYHEPVEFETDGINIDVDPETLRNYEVI
jgi:hypothetical protein